MGSQTITAACNKEASEPWLTTCYFKGMMGTKGYAVNTGSAVFFHQSSSYCSSAVNFLHTA